MSEDITPTPEQPAEQQPPVQAEAETPAQEESAPTDWQAEARKWEKRAKENMARIKEAEPKLAEWTRLKEESKSELERAQDAAVAAEGRIKSMLRDVAAAKVETALAGLPDELRSTLLEDINVDRFIKDDGSVDADAIAGLRTKYAAFAPASPAGMKQNPAQGRSASPAPSIGDQIAQASAAGDFKTAIRLKAAQSLESSDQ
jgi:hypothetical protein